MTALYNTAVFDTAGFITAVFNPNPLSIPIEGDSSSGSFAEIETAPIIAIEGVSVSDSFVEFAAASEAPIAGESTSDSYAVIKAVGAVEGISSSDSWAEFGVLEFHAFEAESISDSYSEFAVVSDDPIPTYIITGESISDSWAEFGAIQTALLQPITGESICDSWAEADIGYVAPQIIPITGESTSDSYGDITTVMTGDWPITGEVLSPSTAWIDTSQIHVLQGESISGSFASILAGGGLETFEVWQVLTVAPISRVLTVTREDM